MKLPRASMPLAMWLVAATWLSLSGCRSRQDVTPYPTEGVPTQNTPPDQTPPGVPPRPGVPPDEGDDTEVIDGGAAPFAPSVPNAPPDPERDGREGRTVRNPDAGV